MTATHRVINSNNKTVGYIINNNFINLYNTRRKIDSIDNLKVLRNKVIRADKRLSVMTCKQLNNLRYQKLEKENPFKRDIQNVLKEWKNDSSKHVLEIKGARQIGKTTEILKFGYKNYENVIYVNMSDDTYNFKSLYGYDLREFFMEEYCERANLPSYDDNSNTLLVIDEIQVSQEIYNVIRWIDNKLGCDVIVTGSYLGRVLQQGFFQPAGNLEIRGMFNLNFREFCRIFGEENRLNSISLCGQSRDKEYDKIYSLYDVYRQIGGYPAVIMEYIKTKDTAKCMDVIGKLLSIFYDESANYFDKNEEKLIFDDIYSYIINSMGSNKRGSSNIISDMYKETVDKNKKKLVTRKELSRATVWLESCGMVGICEDYDLMGDGTNATAKKLYLTDCGITNYLGKSNDKIDGGTLQGILTETFVYCEFMRLYSDKFSDRVIKGRRPKYLVYGDYELDFVARGINDVLYGIEVKTTTGVPKSLQVMKSKGLIDKAVVAKRTKGGDTGGILTIPIFTVGCRFPYE